MSERARFQSQLLLQLSRLARWCSGLARSYSSKRKALYRSVRLRSNTCTSTTRFRKFRGTEFHALGQDSRFESGFANSGPRLLSQKFFFPLLYNGARLWAERVCPPRCVVNFTATVNPVLKRRSDPKPIEQLKPNYFGGANFED